MMSPKIFISLILFSAGFLIGYMFKDNSQKSISNVQQIESQQVLPECFLGRCPEYFSMDVDGDDLAESVVIIPTRMTKGAGMLWIIDEGKAVFKTPEMKSIWVEQSPEQAEKGNQFTLIYGKDPDSNDLTKVKYYYNNQQYEPSEK